MIPEQEEDQRKPAKEGDDDAPSEEEYRGSWKEGHAKRRTGRAKLPAEHGKLSTGADLLTEQKWTLEVFGLEPEVFCQPVVRGYALQIKLWGEFDIDLVVPVKWNTDAFEKLAIEQSRKRLISALVLAQNTPEAAVFDDMIAGKGRGLILLLAGPPGTGKTLTAESVADLLQLPSYTLDASELGTGTTELERDLGEILHLTERWNAVLLINEADAFLEKRGDHPDAQSRNKRVAVFLRMLEYYKGVLILTTNRAIDFDEAFFSRIHLSPQYPELGFDARKEIWTSFLQQRAGCSSFEKREIDELAQRQYNGREIKNIVSMANRLAESEKESFSLACIKDVMSVLDTDLLKSGRGVQQQ